jgi:hypothetical protein
MLLLRLLLVLRSSQGTAMAMLSKGICYCGRSQVNCTCTADAALAFHAWLLLLLLLLCWVVPARLAVRSRPEGLLLQLLQLG